MTKGRAVTAKLDATHRYCDYLTNRTGKADTAATLALSAFRAHANLTQPNLGWENCINDNDFLILHHAAFRLFYFSNVEAYPMPKRCLKQIQRIMPLHIHPHLHHMELQPKGITEAK